MRSHQRDEERSSDQRGPLCSPALLCTWEGRRHLCGLCRLKEAGASFTLLRPQRLIKERVHFQRPKDLFCSPSSGWCGDVGTLPSGAAASCSVNVEATAKPRFTYAWWWNYVSYKAQAVRRDHILSCECEIRLTWLIWLDPDRIYSYSGFGFLWGNAEISAPKQLMGHDCS